MTGKLLMAWNTSVVTLIPKIACPSHPEYVRPISFCHVPYKCISKLIFSRLKLVLDKIINPAQGAFIASRSIVHNVLLCQDVAKHYSRKHCLPSTLQKIDLYKTYDMIDWQFIKDMLIALQFPTHFIKISMSCITSTSYSLLINGQLL